MSLTAANYYKILTRPPIKYCPHVPMPKQWELLNSKTLETFYGGAWAGGKSDGQLMAALLYVDRPDYHALLLRRTYSDLALPEAIMNRLHNWLGGSDARWNASEHTYEFPGGATITFGYLENWRDRYRYRSAEFQYVGLDEGQQFTEEDALYTFSYLRKKEGSTVPLRWILTANPGDIGHEWLDKRYALDANTLETRGIGSDITVIRSQFEDNPHVDPVSLKNLEKLDPVTFAQLRWGNWGVSKSGGLFSREKFPILDEPPHPSALESVVRYWDLAATAPERGKDPDYTSGLKLAYGGGVYTILDLVHGKYGPEQLEEVLRSTAQLDGYQVKIREEQEGGASGAIVINAHKRLFSGYDFQGVRVTGSKLDRARPCSAAASHSFIRLMRAAWNDALLAELQAFPYGPHDDIVDSLTGAYNELTSGGAVVPINLASTRSPIADHARGRGRVFLI